MPDISMISGALGSIKSAGEIIKGIVSIRDASLIEGHVAELKEHLYAARDRLMTVQSDHFDMLEVIRALKEEIMQMKEWDTEKARYNLKEIGTGVYAYVVKETERGEEPPHKICAACYANGKKSILQFVDTMHPRHRMFYKCHHCKSEMDIDRYQGHLSITG